MTKLSPWVVVAGLAAVMTAGCGHLNLVPIGEPERVLTGTVSFPEEITLPQDATVEVRVLDEGNASLPLVLGDQTITNPSVYPIPFKVEYNAEDDLLRRGLNIEVRVSYGGSVRYSNTHGTLLTANDVNEPHNVRVESTSQ
jgi:uncharacterized lipoprotein YbaY